MNTPLEILPQTAERLAWAVLHSLWQGAAIAAALALTLRMMRRSSAAARHAVCFGALLLTFLAALVTAGIVSPRSAHPVSTPIHRPEQLLAQPAPHFAETINPAAGADFPTPELDATSPAVASTAPIGSLISWRERIEPWLPWIAGAWMVGVLLLSLRHYAGWSKVRSLRRSGLEIGGELEAVFHRLVKHFCIPQAVRLVESPEALTPMLTGLLKPLVILPTRVLTGLGPAEIEAILAHELAHLVRRDAWSNLAQIIIETVLFYHPAIWWMNHRTRIERENAADDLALEVCDNRRIYAGALVRLAELNIDPTFAVAATGGHLLSRIRRILVVSQAESNPTSLSFGVPATIAAVALISILGTKAAAEDPRIFVGPGESIQAAIDGAPSGAVIELREGEWKERIVISKPLTLQGAGWEKSRVTIEEPPADELSKVVTELNPRMRNASTPEERNSASTEWIKRVMRPAIWVHDAPVKIQGLRVQGISKFGPDSGGTVSVLVLFQRSKSLMANCTVAGPFGNGIHLTNQSDVEITSTLVAALWGEGIIVRGKGRDESELASRLHLADSEIRNVYHYGIAIGGGCDSTLIERCRISGTAWHGIRYDNASPTITGNLIFGNARFGIYASGTTAAKVRDNVLWRNEMEGMWCLSGNADVVEGNTFVGNLRGGIAVSGAKPTLTRNIIINSPIGISCSSVNGRDGQSAPGDPVLTENLLFNNPIALQVAQEKKPAPEGTVTDDPKLRDLSKQDFALAADSPARSAKIGAADPLPTASSWPLLAEEKSITPPEESRDSAKWKAPDAPAKPTAAQEQRSAEVGKTIEAWIADAFQLDNVAKRMVAIEKVRAMMQSTDTDEARSGINAFNRLGQIEFDKTSFRPIVRKLIGSSDAATRSAAASALNMTGAEPEDLVRVFALADDPSTEVRDNLANTIVWLTKHDLTGKDASDAILKLMQKLPKDSRSVAHALWGSKFSPEIETRVLEYCKDISGFEVGYNFFYGSLSTQANKSEASVKRLIEILADEDTTNKAGRAAWGLQQGVDKAQYSLVSDAMLKVIGSRADGYLRRQAFICLANYVTPAQIPAIRELLAKPGLPADFRRALEESLVTAEVRSNSNPTGNQTTPPTSTTPTVESPSIAKVEEKPEIEVEWQGRWWPATILKREGERTQIHYVGYGSNWDEWVTKERVRPLSTAEPANNAASSEKERAAQLVEKNRVAARVRARLDRDVYTPEQLREIETLYQVANTKGKRTEEARTSLKQLLEKYDKANRTGCALLYLGQGSEGDERLDYLTRAVEKFSDCYYFNGCQVGGYGRYVLLLTLWDRGEKDKARTLLNDLKTTYKDATDHSGHIMGVVAAALEKELEGQK